MKKRVNARLRNARRGGFTLIEILVALAIFVIGALAIVRIFPPALGVIQNSENRTIATNLSRGVLASYDNDSGLIPDGVYDTDTNFQDAAFVGGINTNNALPADGTPGNATYDASSFGHFKRIQGERQRVLADGGQPYVLTQFPYDWRTTPAGSNIASAYVEDRVEGVRVYTDPTITPNGSGVLDFSNARLASDGRTFNDADYTNPDGSAAHTPPGSRQNAPREWTGAAQTMFYATYNWSNGGRIQGVVDEPMSAAATQLKAASIGAKNVVDGSISLRVRRLAASYNAVGNEANAMRGYLPLPYTGVDDLKRGGILVYPSVSLTYNVRDWRWIVEDTTLPPGTGAFFTDYAVSTRYIDAENLTDNQRTNPAGAGSVFTLVSQLPSSTNPPVANVIDRARWDGANPTTSNGTGLAADPNDDSKLVNAKKGLVHFADNANARHARTVYWTTDQWARQLSVAARSYVPFYPTAGNREAWREYSWFGPTGTLAEKGTIYFRPSEVGKSVIVAFEYWADTDNDGIGDTFLPKTAPMTIDDDTVAAPAFMSTFGNSQVARLQITDPKTSGAGVYDVRAIRSIRGASVMVRTAWADGGKYQQEVASTYRPLDQN